MENKELKAEESVSGEAGAEEKYFFFPTGSLGICHSYNAGFKVDKTTYLSVEQYLLQQKALFYKNKEIAEAVMKVKSTNQLKKFEKDLISSPEWETQNIDFVKTAYTEQLKQNPKLKRQLFETGGVPLVYASTKDRIMGIGLAYNDPSAKRKKNWAGKNLLGEILTQVRDELLLQRKPEDDAVCGDDQQSVVVNFDWSDVASSKERYTYFWRAESPFSQHHPVVFELDGHTYNCAEQYMMHQKAVKFGDDQIATKIMNTDDPAYQKSLARKVHGFIQEEWDAIAKDVVKRANIAKFSQNKRLREMLFATEGTELVEASPKDDRWGIGLEAVDPRSLRKVTWKGTNMLGKILTEVRDELMQSKFTDDRSDAHSGMPHHNFTLFRRSVSPFHHQYPARFTVDGVIYCSVQQYVIHRKAILFNESNVGQKIMQCIDVKKQEDLDYSIKNFNRTKWSSHNRIVLITGNYAKFSQNKNLRAQLLDTMGTVLVFESRDKELGNGREEDENSHNRSAGQGQNLLGLVLTHIREKLLVSENVKLDEVIKDGDDLKKYYNTIETRMDVDPNAGEKNYQSFGANHNFSNSNQSSRDSNVHWFDQGQGSDKSHETHSTEQYNDQARWGRDQQSYNRHSDRGNQRYNRGTQHGDRSREPRGRGSRTFNRNNSGQDKDNNYNQFQGDDRGFPGSNAHNKRYGNESGRGKQSGRGGNRNGNKSWNHHPADDVSKASKYDKFTFFWTKDSPFSQWHSSRFEVDGIKYNCAEQYMMHQKALHFNDHEVAQDIMFNSDPKKLKDLGREVRNYEENSWNRACKAIVKKGNIHKFEQNRDLLQQLFETSGTELVEASPYDRKWGIGLEATDPRAMDRKQWRGQNLLGQVLTEVRDELMEKQSTATSFSVNVGSPTHVKDNKSDITDTSRMETNVVDSRIQSETIENMAAQQYPELVQTRGEAVSNSPIGAPGDMGKCPPSLKSSSKAVSGVKVRILQEKLKQFHIMKFIIDGQTYDSAEQYMIHQKALMFDDTENADQVLRLTSGMKIMKVDKKITNNKKFNQALWESSVRDIIKKGNLAKFSQNDELKMELLSTGDDVLVFAEPKNHLLGTGLEEKAVKQQGRWPGRNLLGEVLVEVRNELRSATST